MTVLTVACLALSLLSTRGAEFVWDNSNVEGAAPAATLDWFSGGSNDQGVWLGSEPLSNISTTQISIFKDCLTPLENAGPGGNSQTINLNNGGETFFLQALQFNGLASDNPGADMSVKLTGDRLQFARQTSPVGGSISVSALDNVDYNTKMAFEVANSITVGSNSYAGTLRLINSGPTVLDISGPIGEAMSTGAAIEKYGVGEIVLSGANAISGGITVWEGTLTLSGSNETDIANEIRTKAGTLVFDLAVGNDRWSGGEKIPKIHLHGGKVVVKGAPTGTSQQTVDLAAGYYTQSELVIDPNGGEGTTLYIDSWTTMQEGTYHAIYVFDISAPGSKIVASPPMSNGLITDPRARFYRTFVRDAGGIGFGTVEDGEIVRFTGANLLAASGNSSSKHYKLSCDLTLTADATVGSLEIDTSTGSGVLDLGGNTLNAPLLITGDNDFTIKNGIISVHNRVLAHFGSGTLTIDAAVTNAFKKAGPGRVILNANNTFVVDTATGIFVADGVLEAVDGVNVPEAATLRLVDGVFQSRGSLARNVNPESSGDPPRIAWYSSNGNKAGKGGGFAARGGNLTVNLNDGGLLYWNTGGFVTSGQALVFGSTSADSMVIWQNDIDLAGRNGYGMVSLDYPAGSFVMREFRVNDNPDRETDIARMTGDLSGTRAGLAKTGDGVLSLAGDNSYGGPTEVRDGTLLLDGSLSLVTQPLYVRRAGALGGSGTIARDVEVYGVLAISGTENLELTKNCRLHEGASLRWAVGTTARIAVEGALEIPLQATVVFDAPPAERVVLMECSDEISGVGIPGEWEVVPANVAVRLSKDGKKIEAQTLAATLIIVF